MICFIRTKYLNEFSGKLIQKENEKYYSNIETFFRLMIRTYSKRSKNIDYYQVYYVLYIISMRRSLKLIDHRIG
jgi:hypothetical protein